MAVGADLREVVQPGGSPPVSGEAALQDDLRHRVVAECSSWGGTAMRRTDPTGSSRELSGPELSKARARALAGSAIRRRFGAVAAADSVERAVEVVDDLLGYGPVEAFLEDPGVTEIMINGPGEVWVERGGILERTDARFTDASHLRSFIERVIGPLGLRIDDSSPIVDARLPDGSRFHAVLAPVARGGPVVTVRKFSKVELGLGDLVRQGALSTEAAELLERAVRGRANIVVSGGTSTGKTTLLDILSSLIGPGERVVTVEDAAELQLRLDHVVSLEARPANSDGAGEVTLGDLVRAALRMRPDRIILGEVRGAEALYMLQAMNTGHEGSLTTVHANSPADAFFRIETMTLMANLGLSQEAVRMQMASALDLVVHLVRLERGKRVVSSISCVEDGRAWPGLVTLFSRAAAGRSSSGSTSHGLIRVSDGKSFEARLARRERSPLVGLPMRSHESTPAPAGRERVA